MKRLHLILALGTILFGCGTNQQTADTSGQETDSGLNEIHRPQFHFTPRAKWMNDPNGMVYHNGEYHLFYQHNPDSTVWGPMHWGHAVSKDMVHWEHLPIALYPDSLGTIFSGSAVVDIGNTSGLGSEENPAMVAIYTYHNAEAERAGRNDFQTQGLAFSLDNGRTWEKYKKNPVMENPGIRDFRDPKVSWYEAGKKWIMTLAVSDHISFYSSKNLLDWQHESDFGKGIGAHGGVWECPDLFKMPVEGTNQEKWVLLVSINPGGPNGGSATQYFVGEFDGKSFTLDKEFLADQNTSSTEPAEENKDGVWLDYGRDNYAGVTWANVPEQDGRRLFMGWMSNWDYANQVPTENWRSAMTIARTLTLENTAAGLRVASKPVKELQNIFDKKISLKDTTVTNELLLSEQFTTFDLKLSLEPVGQQTDFAIELSNDVNQKVLIGYDATKGQYYIDRTSSGANNFSENFAGIQYAPRISTATGFDLRLLVDVASVELFADGGKTAMTAIFFPDEKFTKVRLLTPNGRYKLTAGEIVNLKSIYDERVAKQ
ncbi:glycoside hydrolase family 32 protein [Pontibacter harenae]|uniref:glycoside hydrolase family 32 protein n=1 Tax=Pontibacter harenae TaxID=2894083 RepID=UPI001E44FFA6|nr:glycoside hydrolase family 32 protein [Pontibacter harenae]MCC9167721.1 glycoside hydrolase family 32 protein [Pontibacter harenae]